MCCVEYQLCATYNSIALVDYTQTSEAADEGDKGVWNEGFSIDLALTPYEENTEQGNLGLVDSQCTGDYVEIPCT